MNTAYIAQMSVIQRGGKFIVVFVIDVRTTNLALSFIQLSIIVLSLALFCGFVEKSFSNKDIFKMSKHIVLFYILD